MLRRLAVVLTLGLVVGGGFAPRATADEIADQVAVIAKVGPQGVGSAEARRACDALSRQPAETLPRLLTAMEAKNPIAANWYRSAYEKIVEREFAAAAPSFPQAALEAYVADAARPGRLRRLTLTLCDRLNPGFAKQLVRRSLDDPEFRDDAIDMALAAGQDALEGGDSETARDEFTRAFEHARDATQTQRAAEKLAALGEHVDIAAHLGLIKEWWLVGPFAAPGVSGFAKPFPPEEKVDLRAEYDGADGNRLRWTFHQTSDVLGLVNLVQALAPVIESVGYAYAEVTAPAETPAQLRCGADDNCTVWVNGVKVFGREQWLNGIRFDRFMVPITLQRGVNRVLVKVCQGPSNKDPQVPNNWSLQLRICDATGRGIGLTSHAANSPKPTP